MSETEGTAEQQTLPGTEPVAEIETAPVTPAPVEPPKADERDEELKALRADKVERDKRDEAARKAKLSADQQAAEELAEIKAETARHKRDLAFTKAGVPDDLQGMLTVPEGSTPEKAAAKFMKLYTASVKAAATSDDVGAPINPTSGDAKGGPKPASDGKAKGADQQYYDLSSHRRKVA